MIELATMSWKRMVITETVPTPNPHERYQTTGFNGLLLLQAGQQACS